MTKYLRKLTSATTLLCCVFLAVACGGENFDESQFPEDQRLAHLAFKRMSEHGRMEPVLEEGTKFSNWQFYVGAKQATSLLDGEEVTTVYLEDGSGIEYEASSQDATLVRGLALGTYGFASGTIKTVERELAEGEIEVELILEKWRARAQ